MSCRISRSFRYDGASSFAPGNACYDVCIGHRPIILRIEIRPGRHHSLARVIAVQRSKRIQVMSNHRLKRIERA